MIAIVNWRYNRNFITEVLKNFWRSFKRARPSVTCNSIRDTEFKRDEARKWEQCALRMNHETVMSLMNNAWHRSRAEICEWWTNATSSIVGTSVAVKCTCVVYYVSASRVLPINLGLVVINEPRSAGSRFFFFSRYSCSFSCWIHSI